MKSQRPPAKAGGLRFPDLSHFASPPAEPDVSQFDYEDFRFFLLPSLLIDTGALFLLGFSHSEIQPICICSQSLNERSSYCCF